MKLWSGTLSPFSAKVRMALREKEIKVEISEIPWSRATLWGPKPPAFLAANPRGEVPVLEDGDLAIVDSTVINEYLEEKYPAKPLLPATLEDRVVCRMFEDQADHHMTVDITRLISNVFVHPESPDRSEIDEATGRLLGFFTALNRRLENREFLCDEFSLADISCFLTVGFANTLGPKISDEQKNLEQWFDRMNARPVIASEFQAMMSAAASA